MDSSITPLQKMRELKRELLSQEEFNQNLDKALQDIGLDDDLIQTYHSTNMRKTTLIKDSVWGMVEFTPMEMAIIDSPVMQRLRGVNQLGFSFLTYPSAEHSRFSHSLGVAHVVKRLLHQTELNVDSQVLGSADLKKIEAANCSEEESRFVIHAALLHDIGHFPFSHVTENAFHHYEKHVFCGIGMEDFTFAFSEFLGIQKPRFAECLSAAIVISDRFFNFYKTCVYPEAREDDLLKIALIICGIPPDESSPGISSIISHSNVDADKIDYLSRDSIFCGIPVGIDAARLFYRTMFLNLTSSQLKEFSPEGFLNASTTQKHFIINASGIDTIDEIVHARSIMFQRVYRHKTTRLAERLFEQAMLLPKNKIDALEVWKSSQSSLLDELPNADIRKKLKYRILPKRSISFGKSQLKKLSKPPITELNSDFYSVVFKEIIGRAISLYSSDVLAGENLDEFEAKLSKQASILANLLEKDKLYTDLPSTECTVAVLSMESIEGNYSNKNHIILSGKQLGYYKAASKRNQQTEGDGISRKIGYVFCPIEWREIVHLATRKHFFLESLSDDTCEFSGTLPKGLKGIHYTIRFSLDREKSARAGNVDERKLEKIEHFLANHTDFYSTCPSLYQNDMNTSSNDIKHLEHFNGVGEWKINLEHVKSFIQQFPPKLRSETLELIKKTTLIGRSEIEAGTMDLVEKANAKTSSEVKDRIIYPFTPNSGRFITMFAEQGLRQQLSQLGWKIETALSSLKEVIQNGGAVLFLDDNIGSGHQARAQFYAYSGVEKNSRPKELQTENNATEEQIFQEKNTHNNLFLGVLIADPTGVASVANDELVKKLDITILHHQSMEKVSCNAELSPELEKFLTQVGKELIKRNWEKASSEDCENNALGYDNKQALLSTLVNVPTATLTAFWMPGVYNKMPWIPLFIRRGYLNKLVI